MKRPHRARVSPGLAETALAMGAWDAMDEAGPIYASMPPDPIVPGNVCSAARAASDFVVRELRRSDEMPLEAVLYIPFQTMGPSGYGPKGRCDVLPGRVCMGRHASERMRGPVGRPPLPGRRPRGLRCHWSGDLVCCY
jgi:hypothetical protein